MCNYFVIFSYVALGLAGNRVYSPEHFIFPRLFFVARIVKLHSQKMNTLERKEKKKNLCVGVDFLGFILNFFYT